MSEITMSDLCRMFAGKTREQRLVLMPILSSIEQEVLRQLRRAVRDEDIMSKSARDLLDDRGLVVRFNGWQIVSELGLIVLETFGWLD